MLFPPQLVSGLTVCDVVKPVEVVLEVTDTQVVQEYAQVLQQSLADFSREVLKQRKYVDFSTG